MRKLGENLRLRLLSLFIAILLWAYVINIQNPEIKKDIENIPVQIVNVDTLASYGLILADHGDLTTTVKIKGKQEAVKKLSEGNIEATIDLKGCNKPGKVSFPIKFSLSGAQGVEVEGLPDKVDLQIERYTQAQKEVDVVLQGNKNKNAVYEVKSIQPNMVTISGPESLIKNIHSVKVFVDVTNQEKEISVVKRYRVLDSRGTDITDSGTLVRDNQNIQVVVKYYKAKEVPVLPNLLGQVPAGYYIAQTKVEPDRLLVYGEDGQTDKIDSLSTGKIDISNATEGMIKEIEPIIPSTVKSSFTGKIKLSLDIEKEQKKTVDINSSDIRTLNSTENYEYKILTPSVQMNLAGKNGILDSLSMDELTPSVDVLGLGPGDYRMKVRISKNDNFEIDGDNPIVKLKIIEK